MAGLLWFLYHRIGTETESSWPSTVEDCITVGGWQKKKMGKQCSAHHMPVGKNLRQAPAIMWKQKTEPCCTSPLPLHDPVFSKVYRRDILENPQIKHQWKASGILPNREVTSHLCHCQDLHRNITGIIFETSPNLPHCCHLCIRLIKSRPRLET